MRVPVRLVIFFFASFSNTKNTCRAAFNIKWSLKMNGVRKRSSITGLLPMYVTPPPTCIHVTDMFTAHSLSESQAIIDDNTVCSYASYQAK